MKRRFRLAVVPVVAALAIVSLASGKPSQTATTTKFKAALKTGQEVPHPKGTPVGASGSFRATLTGVTLKWTLTYSHLSGTPVAAHIHLGARGKNGIAVIQLCGQPDPTACHSPMSGTATEVADDLQALMMKGTTYVNVHTDKNAGGEIRGQISTAH